MAQNWHITSQKLGTVLNEDGTGFSQQWNVGYMVDTGPAAGTRGEVHVTNANLDPDTIGGAIEEMYRRHHAVASL